MTKDVLLISILTGLFIVIILAALRYLKPRKPPEEFIMNMINRLSEEADRVRKDMRNNKNID